MIVGGVPINPGDLRTRITLQRQVVVTHEGGFQEPTWSTVADVWAKWSNVHGSEVWAAQANAAIEPATVMIRYRADVDNTCVVQHNGQIWEIVNVDDIFDRHEYMELKIVGVRAG